MREPNDNETLIAIAGTWGLERLVNLGLGNSQEGQRVLDTFKGELLHFFDLLEQEERDEKTFEAAIVAIKQRIFFITRVESKLEEEKGLC